VLLHWSLRDETYTFYLAQGAVLFASIISCLSWNDLSTRHWTAPTLWYCSILLAITAVITGATQSLVLDHVCPSSWQTVKACLADQNRLTATPQPNGAMVFTLQYPMMCLSYSIVFFLAGLMSFVYSPVAQSWRWDEDTKVTISSAIIHYHHCSSL
jgi:hypothetical protein